MPQHWIGLLGMPRRIYTYPADLNLEGLNMLSTLGVPRATPDYPTLQVLNTILGGDFVSRLNLNLREQKGFTYGVRTGFNLRRGIGPFVMQTSVGTDVTCAWLNHAARRRSAESVGITSAYRSK